MEDVFTEDAGSESSSRVRRLQGPPGKIGPQGIRGIPGVPGITGSSGAPAIVDYDRINRIVTEKVASAVAEINSRITELERNFTELKNATTPSDGIPCKAKDGFYYRQKCYTIPHLSSSTDLDYNEAVAECAKTGALLAEIHDRDQQNVLYDFALTKIPSGRSTVYHWLGMEYQRSTSTLLYRSGKQTAISLFQWLRSYPTSSNKYLVLYVRNDGNSDFGLFNYPPTGNVYGVLCEK